MKEKEPGKFTFEEIFKQNENRIHFHIHQLGIRDPAREFYTEGLYAMWLAYKKYEPEKGPLSTYFNYTIRNRLIDLLRKKLTDEQQQDDYIQKEKSTLSNGNHYGDSKLPVMDWSDIKVEDEKLWEQAFSKLSEKQRKWVYYYIIRDMSLKEIAKQEGTSVEAVKDWGKQARKKLKEALKD
ncbi:sigma-70 family RNA polymerase sigma factor [Oceanobacillus salinisoli]|uniref:sigma-70 family RNA polymerase sigma factor n=1 Tax=Oceanobacillus salinisoli TaxID=2678611 RepID=UPI0012E1CE09|nr:sigma-70 family RNA polymerase sigma factor [Oceanobacillus salinisoli]